MHSRPALPVALAFLLSAVAMGRPGGPADARLSDRALDPVRRAVEEQGYGALWQVGTPLEGVAAAWQAPNRAQGLRTFFTPEGVWVVPRIGGPQAFRLGLAARGVGRGAKRVPLPAAAPEPDGARVEYRRGPLIEWFVNTPRGLHQGFTIEHDPLPGSAPLELELDVRGDLAPRALPDANAVRFEDAHGRTRLSWSGLLAFDAAGRLLESTLRVVDERIVVRVEDAGARFPLTIDPILQSEHTKLIASDASAQASFGDSMRMEGTTLVVAASTEQHAGPFSGAVYVFSWNGTAWVEDAKLTGSDTVSGDQFGFDVDLSGDRIIVGSESDGPAALQLAGQVYVFVKQGGVWVEEQKFQPNLVAQRDRFGDSVAIEGDIAVIGAPTRGTIAPENGSVFVYTRDPVNGWLEGPELLASDAAQGDLFGVDVAIEGGTIVVGAYFDSLTGFLEGSAYVFVPGGGGWVEQAKLTASDAADLDQFGWRVDISGDTVAVTARFDDDNGSSSGSVYVFDRVGTTWSETQKLIASDGAAGDRFGWAIDLDGDLLVAGAPRHDRVGSDDGAAYLFQRGASGWQEIVELVASDASGAEELGTGVALSGNWAAAGAFGDNSAGAFTGAAYVFELFPGTPYCFGDGTGAICPCGNFAGAGEGCLNSSGRGALLTAVGSTSVSSDDLVMGASGLIPGQPALLFSAANAINSGNGIPFGDGLRCAGGGIKRLGVRVPDAQGQTSWGPALSGAGGWVAGDVRRFQAWYRDPSGSPCGSGFNLSNGVEISFQP